MNSVSQPEPLTAETLEGAELDAARGGALSPADLIGLLRPVRPRLPLPHLPLPKPIPDPLPRPLPGPIRVLPPVLFY